MLSKTSQAYIAVAEHYYKILNGIVVTIDPSIGSTSSMPGYAVHIAGVLQESGVLKIDRSGSIPQRLQELTHRLRKLYSTWNPDVLVYEDIPSQRFGGGNANAHASLLKAVGATLSVSGPECYVGITPSSWKKMARPEYVKSDENDALEISYIVLQEAARIGELEEARKSRKKTKKEATNAA